MLKRDKHSVALDYACEGFSRLPCSESLFSSMIDFGFILGKVVLRVSFRCWNISGINVRLQRNFHGI